MKYPFPIKQSPCCTNDTERDVDLYSRVRAGHEVSARTPSTKCSPRLAARIASWTWEFHDRGCTTDSLGVSGASCLEDHKLPSLSGIPAGLGDLI